MVKHYAALLMTAALISACDYFPGPTLVNGYDTNVDVTVTYSDGTSTVNRWPPCFATKIGNDGLAITNVVIKRDGRLLQQLDGDAVLSMLEKEKSIRTEHIDFLISDDGILPLHENAGPCANKPTPTHTVPIDSADNP